MIRVILDSELISPWSHMEWSEEDDEKYLVIHHMDSGTHGIPVSSFKIPDWQPEQ